MVELSKVQEIAEGVAKKEFARPDVESVIVEPSSDSEGRDALRIIIVLTEDAVAAAHGDTLIDTLAKIQSGLERAGEGRFPIIEYATRAELEAGGEP